MDGKAYDMSTMFIPGGSLTCSDTSNDDTRCIETILKEMIDISKEQLEPADDFFTLNTTSQMLEIIPELLQEYELSVHVIIAQLLRTLT